MNTLIANVGVLIANLVVLGLVLKLYTEFFKQAAQMNRGKHNEDR